MIVLYIGLAILVLILLFSSIRIVNEYQRLVVFLHLAQVYGVYSYRVGGSPDDVEEHGYWNEELARRWMAEADFLVVEEDSLAYTPSPEDVLNLASYTRIILPPVNPCKSDTRLFVYRHSP